MPLPSQREPVAKMTCSAPDASTSSYASSVFNWTPT